MQSGLSPRHRRVVAAARLKRGSERADLGITLLEGPHLVEEALDAGWRLQAIFAVAADRSMARWETAGEVVLVSEEALRRLSSTRTPQSPVAVLEIPSPTLALQRSLLVAWRVTDPGNLGAMIRSAAAFGCDLAVTAGSTDPWSPKVLRAAAGGHFHTSVVQLTDLGGLGATMVVSLPRGGRPPSELPEGRIAVLIGSEAHGLPERVVREADFAVSIPMRGTTESLNAAVAAGIIAYEISRRQDPSDSARAPPDPPKSGRATGEPR